MYKIKRSYTENKGKKLEINTIMENKFIKFDNVKWDNIGQRSTVRTITFQIFSEKIHKTIYILKDSICKGNKFVLVNIFMALEHLWVYTFIVYNKTNTKIHAY